MENKKREIAKFYEQIFSDTKLKGKLEEKAKAIANEEDLKNLIQQEIVPLMKKYNVNFSEKELLEYEEETLKKLSKEDLDNVSGGVSIKSALLTGGLLSMALLGGVGLNSSVADASGGQPNKKPGTTQQGTQKRKSARKFKPTIKKVKEQSDDDDDDDPRPSQRSEATESAADKTKKVKEEFNQNNSSDNDNDDDDKIQEENKKTEIRKKQKKVKEKRTQQNNGEHNAAALLEKLKKDFVLYQYIRKLKDTAREPYHIEEYVDPSEMFEFISKLRVDNRFRFYIITPDKKKQIIKMEDIEEFLDFYDDLDDVYVPQSLSEGNGSGLYKAIIFGGASAIYHEHMEGKITYNYTDILEIINNAPIEKANYPQFFIDAIDEFRKEGSGINDNKIKQLLKYESKLDNGEETIDKAALRLGEFYKEFLKLTKNDYEEYLKYKEYRDRIKSLQQEFSGSDTMYEYYNKYLESMIEYDKGRDSRRIEELIKGELGYDSVLFRKFKLLDEKTRDAVIKDTEYIASKIKKSGNIPFLEGRFTNYTIDANSLEIINGFNEILPYLLGTADNGHLTYTPCTKGIMGESLDRVASKLIEFLGDCVSRFQVNDYNAYAEEVVWEAVNKDNCFKKVLESLQPTGKKLDASKFLRDDEKEAFKKAKEDIDYLHQYMKPNSDGTWTLKVNMLSRGSKIDGLGMIDYFYNNPELFEE